MTTKKLNTTRVYKSTEMPAAPAAPQKSSGASLDAASLDTRDIDNQERAFLGTCQRLYHANDGDFTPFESFVVWLIRDYQGGTEMTVDKVKRELNRFEETFGDLATAAGEFVRHYPSLFPDLKRTEITKEAA